MLFFDYLKNLDAHISLLQKKIKDKHTLFLVGGCIRDPLLGIEKKPTDIDFTMAGEPKKIDKLIDKTGMSYFMTEKFGTMTLIKDTMKYELTPLRTESDYTDSRHPDVINRSNDLLLDSKRRDFTINCMYYTNAPYKTEYTTLIDKKNIHKYSDDETFLKRLDDHGYLYITNQKLLIIQDHKIIAKLFADGKFQADQIKSILKSATAFTIGKKAEAGKLLRILVDPHKGIHDSINRRLKAVGDPDNRFTEDALRIIRAIRFVNVLNAKLLLPNKSKVKLFDFDKLTRNSVKKNHALIKNVAKERIKEEIMKVFTTGNPFGFIGLLDEAQLLEHLFPALYATKNVEQPIRYHPFDVYVHTLLCLFELQKINKDPIVRLAMLYHDVGKVEQFGAYAE
jgi:tRNA nucleotidyltransferase/poly(A) polymerase